MGLKINQKIGDAFEIVERLPGEGLSVKYCAESLSIEAPVWMTQFFVKEFPADISRGVDHASLREYCEGLSSQVGSAIPALVQPLFAGHVDETIVLAYPYIKGRNLSAFILRNSDHMAAHRVALEMIKCVSAMHDSDVHHNRLTPSNILVSRNSTGIERSICFVDTESLSIAENRLIGRPHNETAYASPEQRELQDCSMVGDRSDVYSLGRIVIDLLSSALVPGAKGASLHEPDVALDDIAKKMGAEIAEVLAASHHPSPTQRPKAIELLSVFSGFQGAIRRSDWRQKDISHKDRSVDLPKKTAEITDSSSSNRRPEASPSYIEIRSCDNDRFRRRYLDSQKLTDRDIVGSGATPPRGELFELEQADGIWYIHILEQNVALSVGGEWIPETKVVRVDGEVELSIYGAKLRVGVVGY